jgi:hypothetical protein
MYFKDQKAILESQVEKGRKQCDIAGMSNVESYNPRHESSLCNLESYSYSLSSVSSSVQCK